MIYEGDGSPVGWQGVTLTDAEREALVDAADAEDAAAAERIVEGAYSRHYARIGGEILAAEGE
jgi:hypothetical protein